MVENYISDQSIRINSFNNPHILSFNQLIHDNVSNGIRL